MESFEELAMAAYPLWMGCIGDDPSKWELSDDELQLVDKFVHECINLAMKNIGYGYPRRSSH